MLNTGIDSTAITMMTAPVARALLVAQTPGTALSLIITVILMS